jgi:hypothetical protein
MRYEVQYAEGHERKTHIIEEPDNLAEATSLKKAKKDTMEFLNGRTLISFLPLHLPTVVLKPKPEFLPMDEVF